jgi:hypothetical protein
VSAGAHAAPLVPRWCAVEIGALRAGAPVEAHVTLENGGSATWYSRGRDGLQLSYHWLDPLGNPVVWDGTRTAFPRPVAPGETVELELGLDAPRPPGRYVLRLDLVEEHRFWLEELGCATHDTAVDVLPRIEERRLRVVVHGGTAAETDAALAAQLEPVVDGEAEAVAHLVAGAVPAPDWSRLLLDAHAEGWRAVGPAVVAGGGLLAARRARRVLGPWAPGGRNPRLGVPLLLPSLLDDLETDMHLGLPAYGGADGLFEGHAAVRLPQRSDRRPT